MQSDEAPVLVLGLTGAGKSTLVNYLLGWNMALTEEGDVVPIESSVPMVMSCAADSETFLPRLQRGIDQVLYCDCPGLNDNRGREMQLCISIIIERIIKRAHHIAGIAVIIDYYSLISERGKQFLELLTMLTTRLSTVAQDGASIVYLFNKVPENVQKSLILKKVQDFADVYDNPLLNSILADKNKVWIINPCDGGRSRVDVMKCVRSLPPLTMSAFNFQYHDPLRDELRSLLDEIILQGFKDTHFSQTLPQEIENLQRSYDELTEEIESREIELQQIVARKINTLQAGVLAHETTRMIQKNQTEYENKLSKKSALEEQLKKLNIEYESLNSAEASLFWEKKHYLPHCHISKICVDVLNTAIDCVSPIKGIASKGIQAVNLLSSLVTSFDKKVIFNYRGPSIVSVCKEIAGGMISQEMINHQAGVFSMTFTGNEDQTHYAAVKIFIEKRHDPKNMTRMQIINQEIQTIQNTMMSLEADINFYINTLRLLNIRLEQSLETSQYCEEINLPNHIKQHIEMLQKRQLKIYAEKFSKEEEYSKVREHLNRNSSVYTLTAELLPLLSGIEIEIEENDSFIESFSSTPLHKPENRIENKSDAEVIVELREEVNHLKAGMQNMQNQIDLLTEKVTLLMDSASTSRKIVQKPSAFFQSY